MSKKKPTIRGGAGRQKYDFQTTKPSQTKPNQIDQTKPIQIQILRKKLISGREVAGKKKPIQIQISRKSWISGREFAGKIN